MNVKYLICDRCDAHPTLAKLDGVAHLVCHCTHMDGPIEPIPVDEMALLHDRWRWQE